MTTHYETLGVSKTATPDEIKKAYRKLASQHHPDKGGDTAKFQQVEEAYRILSDPNQRQQYDNPSPFGNHNGQGFDFNFNGQDLNDIFRQFGFGADNPYFRQQVPRRNKDIRAHMEVTLPETLQDIQKTLSVQSSNGQRQTIDVAIPRGVTSGTTMKYPGLGDHMFENLPRGDFYLNITVLPDPKFQTHGLDLLTRLTIDCFQAMLGTSIEINTLDSKTLALQIPAGTQPGTTLRIRGEGLYQMNSHIRGNLLVKVSITIPKELNQQQIELLEKIQSLK